ncbi:MAG TPA: potassium channel family protein, partial [Burkholderiaceae bacterium]|nr:potassium channel family protein [Burkholderiaceae bacterium]
MSTDSRHLDGTPLEAHSVLFLVLRRLRLPLLLILLCYAVSVFGFTLIPGVTPDGVPAAPMSFFHAFYFVSYTATTIGFGEVPQPFSDEQRMWATFVIHLTVVGWTFALLNVLTLFQDRGFRRAAAQIRFAARVRRMREPFHLICGAGDSGQRLIRLLDRLDMRVVVIENDPQRVDDLELEDLHTDVPVLQAEPGLAQSLLTAGLRHPMCRGVLAITPSDDSNLAIVTAARLLNRKLPVIAGAESPHTVDVMRAFEPYKVISPFDTFADNLLLAMRAPGCYRLLDWLTAPPDSELEKEHEPPSGAWVVCGRGRFGTAVTRRLLHAGLLVTTIDHSEADTGAGGDNDNDKGASVSALPEQVHGVGTERAVLERAAIGDAAGLVAATDNDITNLAIAAQARTLNSRLFVVLRQNDAANRVLFDRFGADLVMRPSEIIADECVALLTTPLLDRFLATVRKQDDAWADEVIHQLRKRVGTRSPQ